jgi:hypothetical protein
MLGHHPTVVQKVNLDELLASLLVRLTTLSGLLGRPSGREKNHRQKMAGWSCSHWRKIANASGVLGEAVAPLSLDKIIGP